MPTNRRPKLDVSPEFDFLFELDEDPDVTADPFEKFEQDSIAAGAFSGMSSDVAHRHVAAFDEEAREAKEINQKFAKRFERPSDKKAQADTGDKLAKADGYDEWSELIKRSSRMVTEHGIMKLYDANGELIGEKAVRE